VWLRSRGRPIPCLICPPTRPTQARKEVPEMPLPKTIRAVLTWIVLTAAITTFALVVDPIAEAASTKTYSVTSAVYVRASRSTKATILGQLAKGNHVIATGKAKNGWLPIKYNSRTAYVSTRYVRVDRKAATVAIIGPSGKKTAVSKLAVRPKAKTKTAVTKTYTKGTVVKVTGEAAGIYTKITVNGTVGWALTSRLTRNTDTTPDIVANYVTNAVLSLRTTPLATATNQVSIASGKTVGGTGVHSGSYSQVVYAGKVGWVLTGYLNAVAGTPAQYILPLRVTTVYLATTAAIQSTPAATGTVLGTLSTGTALRGTGATSNAHTAVIWNGTIAWVATAKATISLGSTSLDKLESYGKSAVVEMRQVFPKITTVYGWRASSDYSSDHPNGRAADFMIPSYKTNKAQGDAIAAYVIANGKRLHVTYLIWQQRSYTLSSGKWKAMADRGSDTQNHKDHVHVSFEPSPK
jgi:uncharacterized protein YgiM (DUF1202 family)